MKTVAVEDMSGPVANWFTGQDDDTVVITRSGEPMALLTAVDSLDLETISLSNNPKFWEIIERSRARQNNEGGLSSADVRRELGLPAADEK